MMGFHPSDILFPVSGRPTPQPERTGLSEYRGFCLGMSLLEVARQIRIDVSEARVVHQRPAAILELVWQPQRFRHDDSVQEFLFTFCDGELFRIGVTYDQTRTEGLSLEDMIEGISARYGTAASAAGEEVFPSIHAENVKVLARWEDSDYSLNLVQGSYLPAFGLVMFAKRLNAKAAEAAAEAVRLDKEEAPQVEADRVQAEAAESRARLESARQTNKETFRP